jgi:serine/threonine-protein kinase
MLPGRTNLYERYKLGEVLGHGGMGVLYRAFDRLMQREVALKTILDIEQPQTLDLFYKECGILAAMVHPNIVNVYDIGEFEENGIKKPFFVMPLLPGRTLDVALRSTAQRFTMETLIEIVSQACRGLQAAHEMGLVHRDDTGGGVCRRMASASSDSLAP